MVFWRRAYLRCAGAATAAGLLALVIRFGMLQLLDAEVLHYVAWIAALLPLLAIDLYAYFRAVMRDEAPDWRGTALVVFAAMLPKCAGHQVALPAGHN